MQKEQFKRNFFSWLRYAEGYLHATMFKQILLFIVSFFAFGFLLQGYFEKNFILAIIFLAIDLYLIKKLLYKRARPTKILVILIVLYLAFFSAQMFSETAFNKIGVTSFIGENLLVSSPNDSNELSDQLILSGISGTVYKISKGIGEMGEDFSTEITAGSKEKSIEVYDYINELRVQNGVKKIPWDDKIYELAKYKAEDLSNRNYFDHIDPDGKCAGSYAKQFGMNYASSSFADNLFGYSSPTFFDQKEAVDSWMNSRGHKYNLLFSGHQKGAFACNNQNCVFIGQGGSGWVCDTGEAGLAYWQTASKQPGEK